MASSKRIRNQYSASGWEETLSTPTFAPATLFQSEIPIENRQSPIENRKLCLFLVPHGLAQGWHLFEQFLEANAGQAFQHRRQLADDLGDVAGDLAGPAALAIA